MSVIHKVVVLGAVEPPLGAPGEPTGRNPSFSNARIARTLATEGSIVRR